MLLVAAAAASAVLAAAPPASPQAFSVTGRGWGHGIGMSQYGAQGLALHGWSYRRILAHYYRGTELARTSDREVRILLAQRRRVDISSRRPYRLRDAAGRSWILRPRRIVLRPGLRVRVKGKPVALRPPVVVDPGAAALAFDGAGYRGSLTVHREGGALTVVNHVRLDFYVRGVVGREMPDRWDDDALAAQAVAARSYAVSMLGARQAFDLYRDTRDQVYGGIRAESPPTNQAVGRTARQVLLWNGQVARTYYSSTSGGRTQAVEGVPYLVSVRDPYDSISPHHRWGPLRYTSRRLASLLDVPPPTAFHVARNASGRADSVYVRWRGGGRWVSGGDFQDRLDLRSTWFTIKRPRAAAAPARAKRRNRRS